jgi:hypothetical protein
MEKILDVPFSSQSTVSSFGSVLSQSLLKDVESSSFYNPSLSSTVSSIRKSLSSDLIQDDENEPDSPVIATFRTPSASSTPNSKQSPNISDDNIIFSNHSPRENDSIILRYKSPPSREELSLKKEYQSPFYGKPSDFESGNRTAVIRFRQNDAFDLTRKRVLPMTRELYHLPGAPKDLKSKLTTAVPPQYDHILVCTNEYRNASHDKIKLKYAPRPPTVKELLRDISTLPPVTPERRKRSQFISQISMPTAKTKKTGGIIGFKKPKQTNVTPNTAIVKLPGLSTMCIELHINTRGHLRPDPAHDAVSAIYWVISSDTMKSELIPGCLCVGPGTGDKTFCSDEQKLFRTMVDLVREK